MKKLIFILFTFLFFVSSAQVKLNDKDLKNLIAISELYSKNTNASGEQFAKSIDSLKTPKLNQICQTLIEVGKGDETILSNKYLSRPSNDELTMWYVIREIHYNQVSEKRKPRPNIEVVKEILSQKIDERWLLDNYYYRIHGGIATLFNNADLSMKNIDIEALGFKNETEKCIFYFNIINSLVGPRFKVLLMLKNYDKILSFSEKLPTFNGKKYYYYTDLDFKDFKWYGYEKKESYSEVNFSNLYNVLLAQFMAVSSLKDKKDIQEIYFNSILYKEKYFKYSASKDDLQYLYLKIKS
ncbi:hypothetical protein NYQ10_10470 [Flavobacterium johnsoniae]|uniref:hypothetical protein n=1 Tax=Flavobacterium johnsoniae TaxID=986 RepID=UPI0025AF70EC|nr:hypothetical protein [Flavobacterium johnsoniae]WJS96857.1 hypothetical protein NYQ10_10470 [Flavobacterium johnsoniae]